LEKHIGSKRHSRKLSQKATFLIFISSSHQSSASISVHQPASARLKNPLKNRFPPYFHQFYYMPSQQVDKSAL